MSKQLDPKAFWIFFINSVSGWFFAVLVLSFQFSFVVMEMEWSLATFVWWALGVLVLTVVGAFIYATLTLRFYRYELSPDGLRKESGIIWKRYTTIPYDRIQNVDIHRGIIARILGLSDLQVQTAGAASSYSGWGWAGAGAEGRLQGIDKNEAETLRDELVHRARTSRSQAL